MKSRITYSPVAQAVLRWALRLTPDSFPSRALQKALFLLRALLVHAGDPAVRYAIGRHIILLPVSHELPFNRQNFPEYGENIGRLTGFLGSRLPDLCIVDIGANIGDTVALIRNYCYAPVLCIEPSKKFFRYLEVNCDALGNAIPVQQLLGEAEGSFTGVLAHAGGTASVAAGKRGDTELRTMTLPSLLQSYPAFENARLLKTDTDGFEARILRGARDLLQEKHPVLFLEFDPFFLRRHGNDPAQLLELLQQCGYDRFVAYEEMGDFLLAGSLDNRDLVGDLCLHYTGWGGRRYADLAVFPSVMSDAAIEFTAQERSYYCQKKAISAT